MDLNKTKIMKICAASALGLTIAGGIGAVAPSGGTRMPDAGTRMDYAGARMDDGVLATALPIHPHVIDEGTHAAGR